MILLRVLILSCLMPLGLMGQSGYLLIATYEIKEPGRSWMCRNHALIQEDLVDAKSYDDRRKALLNQYKDSEMIVRLVSPDEAVMVFEYEKEISGWGCKKKVLSVRIGKDLASCQRQLDESVRSWPSDYKTPPKSIFNRAPATETGKIVTKQNWDGVEIEYIYIENKGSDPFLVVKARNTLKDKDAVIGKFLVLNSNQDLANKPAEEYRLEPGVRVVIKLKPAGDYRLGMQLTPASSTTRPFSVIQWVKEHIRAQVTKDYIEDTKTKKHTSFGVRG